MIRKIISALFLIFMFSGLALAQDEEQSPYEIALQRIEQVRVSGDRNLYLDHLGLTELPPEVGTLGQLQGLILGTNLLTSLPPDIGNLGNLTYLSANDNQLSSLPPEIGNLSNLRTLVLYNNQLSSLPPEIGNLASLNELDLRQNQLSSLPPEIGRLSNLIRLQLGFNQLDSIPSEIGRLELMCNLVLVQNNLRELPSELGQLRRLVTGEGCGSSGDGLYVGKNPLISPPQDVLDQGEAAILEYLRNEAWWHLQRLFLGGLSFVGIITGIILGLRWKNRRGKSKRKNGELI